MRAGRFGVRRWQGGGLPIFWQMSLLVLASLIVAQGVSIALFLSLRPPRPEFNRLDDIVRGLSGARAEDGDGFVVTRRPAPPAMPANMIAGPAFGDALARRLAVPRDRIRFFYEPDFHGPHEMLPPGVLFRHGEPIFFDPLLAAVDTGRGWRTIATPPRPAIAAWQRRNLLWFLLSVVLLLPCVGFFARRLTRPIRRFADAADRISADPLAPRLAEEGPAELRVAAHALNQMQARLQAYVDERTAMIGAIAHDLRTPLARVAFRIEGAPDPIRDKVQADIEQMRAMIATTIGFVRGHVRGDDPVAVPLDTLLESMIAAERDMGRPVAADGLEPATIRGDPVAIGRLVQNLIDNGVAYGGGVAISLVRSGSEARMTIADRGPGLDPSRIARIFAPFERGDPSRNRQTGGIGLGLTIARSIAEQHGGRLDLVNREGGGIAAIVLLPMPSA